MKKHKRSQNKSLEPTSSADEVAALAGKVLKTPGDARVWMGRPNRTLGGVAPSSLLDTEAGAKAVKDLLHQIEYGIYS